MQLRFPPPHSSPAADPITLEVDLELTDLELVDADPNAEHGCTSPGRAALSAQQLALLSIPAPPPVPNDSVPREEADLLLRRARALLEAGALAPGVVGSSEARARFHRLLGRASLSPEHVGEVARLRAALACREQRFDDAIDDLRTALHFVVSEHHARLLYADMAAIYATLGQTSEAQYYRRRASSRPPPPTRSTRSSRPSEVR